MRDIGVFRSDAFQTMVGVLVGAFVAVGIGFLARPLAADVPVAAPRIAVVMAVEMGPPGDLSSSPGPTPSPAATTLSAPVRDLAPRLVATRASWHGSSAQTAARTRHEGSDAPPAAPSPPPPSASPDPTPTPSPSPTPGPSKPPKPPKPPK